MSKEISTENHKIRVYWDDKPENYSRETKNKIRSNFVKKYGVPASKVNVVFRPVKTTDSGELIKIGDSGIDNIMDVNYQRELFKEWLKREDIKIDFNRIVALDEKIIAESILPTANTGDVRWGLKWLKVNNFLCFGDNEVIDFTKLHGLNLINSTPKNTGGKTTFSIDTLRFLFFSNTTKTEKNEQIFNTWSGNDEVIVRGGLDLDGDDYVIERGLKRTLKRNKKDYNVSGYVKYSKLFPDGSEMDLDEEESKSTTKKIIELIGSEADFELMILATHRNLTDLIDSTSTNKSRLLNKYVGLDPIEVKEKTVRKMYTAFGKTMQANHYDVTTLEDEIVDHKANIERLNSEDVITKGKILAIAEDITNSNVVRDKLLASKHNIDDEVLSVNSEELETYISDLIQTGVGKKKEVEAAVLEISEIGEIDYDEDEESELQELKLTSIVKQTNLTHDNQGMEAKCHQLKNAEVCPTCNQPLKGVDNSGAIVDLQKQIEENKVTLIKVSEVIKKVGDDLIEVNKQKKISITKDKLELKKDRLEVEMDRLRNKIKEKRNLLKEFNLNRDAIEKNKLIESDIVWETTQIQTFEAKKMALEVSLNNNQIELRDNQSDITRKEGLIKTIKLEDEKERVFKVYIEMIGKRGISKLIMRSLLPIINSELQRLLNGTTNFDVELNINSKNDIEFNMVEDDVIKPLKSGSGFESTAAAIALRSVLSRVTTLPVPNFITFDEIFGTVAEENLPAMEDLFKRVSEMYDFVFLITHNELVKEWADNILTVTKKDHISNIRVV